jgi:hypothetical protein
VDAELARPRHTAAKAGVNFGYPVASGDFNGDGRADLVAGVPAQTVSGAAGAGAVQIIPGGDAGLTSTGSTLWSQATANVPGTPQSDDFFGNSVVALHVTSATATDLLVGVVDETVGGSNAYTGEVEFLHAGTGGLTATGTQVFDDDTAGFAGTPQFGGFAVAVS